MNRQEQQRRAREARLVTVLLVAIALAGLALAIDGIRRLNDTLVPEVALARPLIGLQGGMR